MAFFFICHVSGSKTSEVPRTTEGTTIAIGYIPELDGETLLLKATRTERSEFLTFEWFTKTRLKCLESRKDLAGGSVWDLYTCTPA